MTELAIETRSLTKHFGGAAAVDGVDLSIEIGTIYGLVGPNGAGKTTTVNMLTGLLEPSSGTMRILGEELGRDSVGLKQRLGVMPDDLGLYEPLTGEEYLSLVGYIYGLSKKDVKERMAQLFEFMEIAPARKRPIHQYSHGMKKKLALAGILLHEPDVIFLDEPFENLDPRAAKYTQDALRQLAGRGSTIVLTSHILGLVEKFCSDVALMAGGKIVFSSPTDQIRTKVKNELSQETYADLEDVFLSLTIDGKDAAPKLSWL